MFIPAQKKVINLEVLLENSFEQFLIKGKGVQALPDHV